ncbi:MAM and LDL-receptor class A domain-containing protein 1-like isoform X3 [Acanthaster planci]|uniref:MAM and LDL-receptor class A domain-containing protein 1-like isoform X3 n=1 Tax=Acanthaster planci TaxID=133434 RepID=A0A8B7ZI80_ACAPL|nr:MAM and LDL-receptor class A domain-containing protein 1-like isoform X3 [Acanthaster planci]
MTMELRCYVLLVILSSAVSFCKGTLIINCDFENEADPMCGFYNVYTDDADFKRSSGASSGPVDSSPRFDHTYGNDTGHFLDTDITTFSFDTPVARVISPAVLIQSGTTQLCLEYYVHMFGTALQSLHVYKKVSGVETSIYNDTGTLGDVWHHRQVEIDVSSSSGSSSIQVIFQVNISSGVRGDIALDDIQLSVAQCNLGLKETTQAPPPTTPVVPLDSYDCTFEDPNQRQCMPKPNSRNDFDWVFRQAFNTPNQGPIYDHTTSTSSGIYLYVPQDSNQSNGQEYGEFRTALLQQAFQVKCLQFFYYMRGNRVGNLNGYVVRDGDAAPIHIPFNKTGDQGGYWHRGLLDINPTYANYRIAFEASRNRDYDGCIAVDDLLLMEGKCPMEEVFCDFESLHICYFTQDRTDDMDWTVGNGNTPSYQTGPSYDHTYGNSSGNYMYIETSSPVRLGHVARLISPPVTETHGRAHCLIFWYHMYGQHIDALNVLQANASTPTQRKLIWTLSGNRGDKWRAAEVHVQSSLDFLIIFEAFRGTSYQGDIAIDDVHITSTEGCPGEAGLKNYSSITCDFEEIEICYYKQDSSDDFDWTWQNGASQGLTSTGPGEDHTTNSPLGFYMYIQEDYNDIPGGTARLMSPEAKVQPVPSCLEFWYHMFGRDIESLQVYMKKSSDTELPDDPVWSMTGNKGDYWHRATIDVPVTPYTFSFIFEATRGQTFRDNIAIDDVTFYEGDDCPPFTTSAPIPTTTPIPIASSLANCDFEDVNNTMCGYTQSIHDELDWSHGSGWPVGADNTLGTADGHYLYINTHSYYQRSGDRADLYSPLLMSSDIPQCLEFYYYLSGYRSDFLMVYLTGWGQTLAIDPLFSVFGDQGDKWNMAQVEIPPMNSNFQIVFEGMYSYYADVAIDDINITMGACPKTTAQPNLVDGSCDFESGLKACNYVHMRYYDFYWQEHSGATASKNTGPRVDHTTGTEEGKYMYIEASLPQRPADRARIITPVMYHTAGVAKCMLFYYHMNGANVGKINIYSYIESREILLMSLVGSSKDRWRPAGVDLTNMAQRFQIVFEGVVGYGVEGDMAIDDISIRLEPCMGFAKEASTNFEMPGDLNGFHQYWENDTYWLWFDQYNKDSTLPDELLAGDGSFMYIDGTFFQPKTWATMLTPIMAGHAIEHCLDYDYAIYKDAELMVSVWQKGGLTYDLTIKKYATAWTHERITLTKAQVGEDFMLFFTGKLGSEGTGYVAIDNLVVRENSCSELAEPGEPGAQASSGSVATATILGILLGVALAVIIIGVLYFVRRQRMMPKDIPAVRYTNETDTNENKEISLAKDLSIANPSYENATLQSHA